jgi:hypothetical protein
MWFVLSCKWAAAAAAAADDDDDDKPEPARAYRTEKQIRNVIAQEIGFFYFAETRFE